MIGVMTVAIVVAHWKVGFFIFKPNQGWEYCASIAVTAFVIAMIGPGRWSLDHAARHRLARMDRARHRRELPELAAQLLNWPSATARRSTHDRDSRAAPAQAEAPALGARRCWCSICALIAAMWVYAFGFAPKEGVYFVTDKAWRTSAEQICADGRAATAGPRRHEAGLHLQSDPRADDPARRHRRSAPPTSSKGCSTTSQRCRCRRRTTASGSPSS